MQAQFIAILVLAGISLFAAIKVLKEHERGVVLTLGRFTGVKGPGLVLLVPFIQHMIKVDLKYRSGFRRDGVGVPRAEARHEENRRQG